MSFLQTDPIVTQTSVVEHPNQQILTRTTPSITPYFPLYREKTAFLNPPVTISNAAEMEKPIFNVEWKTSQERNTVIWYLDVDYSFLRAYALSFGVGKQAYSNFQSIKIVLRRTDMANYQGLLIAVFDPAPSNNYYESVFNITRTAESEYQLHTLKEFEPKNTDDIEFEIPFHIPFEMIQMFKNPIKTFLDFYSFGTIRIMVVDPLVTKNTIQSLSYRAAVSVNGYQTVGNVFT